MNNFSFHENILSRKTQLLDISLCFFFGCVENKNKTCKPCLSTLAYFDARKTSKQSYSMACITGCLVILEKTKQNIISVANIALFLLTQGTDIHLIQFVVGHNR